MKNNFLSDRNLQHPVITSMERWGEPDGYLSEVLCPVCGAEAESFYVDRRGDVLGCEDCVKIREAFNVELLLPGEVKRKWHG